MLKVLIVDDSAFMRMKIRSFLETDPNIEIVGIARDGIDAVQKVLTLRPHVITMDVTMPRMSGIEAVEQIMTVFPIPVLMISAFTQEGASQTIEALQKGAVDYISKEELNKDILLKKIYLAAGSPVFKNNKKEKPHHCANANSLQNKFSIVCIGISTGGPKALTELIPQIRADLSISIIIAQHMPPLFTKSLAERLNSISKIPVVEAKDMQPLLPGCAYICPGGMNAALEKKNVISLYTKESFNYTYIPSVDLLMETAGKTYGSNALCIIMTGMGSDGLNGIREARKHGSYVLAQSASTSAIYGMPKAIIENDLQDEIIDLEHIASRINVLCSNNI